MRFHRLFAEVLQNLNAERKTNFASLFGKMKHPSGLLFLFSGFSLLVVVLFLLLRLNVPLNQFRMFELTLHVSVKAF